MFWWFMCTRSMMRRKLGYAWVMRTKQAGARSTHTCNTSAQTTYTCGQYMRRKSAVSTCPSHAQHTYRAYARNASILRRSICSGHTCHNAFGASFLFYGASPYSNRTKVLFAKRGHMTHSRSYEHILHSAVGINLASPYAHKHSQAHVWACVLIRVVIYSRSHISS